MAAKFHSEQAAMCAATSPAGRMPFFMAAMCTAAASIFFIRTGVVAPVSLFVLLLPVLVLLVSLVVLISLLLTCLTGLVGLGLVGLTQETATSIAQGD